MTNEFSDSFVEKTTKCGCLSCQRQRAEKFTSEDLMLAINGMGDLYFRYACEICGNKRCPHHTNHELACTNSNEPNQKGSVY